ncbi:MAG: response regulator [Aquabacterium sp.]|nr:response regulator [Aquabacterium sp.]
MTQARVLLTDDDDMTLEMLEAALQDRYQITLAHSGREAIDKARQAPFDLIVLDVDMPEMDGYEACTTLKAASETANVPVLFLSARVNIDERLRGYRVGGTDYLTKPFDVAELRTKIDLAVEQHARNQQLSNQVEEAMNMALATADMYGEVGVVLEMQRQLANCFTYADIANAFFTALDKMGFEGCLRLHGRQGTASRSGQGECSALGNSILDHLESSKGPTIQPVGDNTSFNYGNVLMLVRNLPMSPQPEQYSQDEIDRLARVRDNVALMAEGIVGRMRALDVETEKSHLEHSKKAVDMTREALLDISAQQHANRMKVTQVFQQMNSEVEQLFIHLGLSETQEELLSNTLRRHITEAIGVFEQSSLIDTHLNNLISRLRA